MMYFMTDIRDSSGKVLLQSCIYTEPATQGVRFCFEHNFPVDKR